jgi:hypothetical protein
LGLVWYIAEYFFEGLKIPELVGERDSVFERLGSLRSSLALASNLKIFGCISPSWLDEGD